MNIDDILKALNEGKINRGELALCAERVAAAVLELVKYK